MNQRKENRKEEILEAGLKVFAEKVIIVLLQH